MPKLYGIRERLDREVYFNFIEDTETITNGWKATVSDLKGDKSVNWDTTFTIKQWRVDFQVDGNKNIRRLFSGLLVIPVIGKKPWPEMVMCNKIDQIDFKKEDIEKTIEHSKFPASMPENTNEVTVIGGVRKLFLGNDEPPQEEIIDDNRKADKSVIGSCETMLHGFMYNHTQIYVPARQDFSCCVAYSGKPIEGLEFLRVVCIGTTVRDVQ